MKRNAGLLNRKALRALFLEVAAECRAHKFSRVSSETMDLFVYRFEREIREAVRKHILTQPSKGKTL